MSFYTQCFAISFMILISIAYLRAVYKAFLLWSSVKKSIQYRPIPSPHNPPVVVFLCNKVYNDGSLLLALGLCLLCIT